MLVGVYEYVGWSVRVCWLECTSMLVGVYEYVGWSVRVLLGYISTTNHVPYTSLLMEHKSSKVDISM